MYCTLSRRYEVKECPGVYTFCVRAPVNSMHFWFIFMLEEIHHCSLCYIHDILHTLIYIYYVYTRLFYWTVYKRYILTVRLHI